jgi:trk system potassium uptake protein TrkA
MRVIIAGGGEFGSRLAEELSKEDEVIVIEKDETRAEYLGDRLHAIVLFGSAADKTVLRHASAEKCDAVLAVTGDDRVNANVCEIAKAFGVKRLVARINDPSNENLFAGTGCLTINLVDSAVREFKKSIVHKHKKD